MKKIIKILGKFSQCMASLEFFVIMLFSIVFDLRLLVLNMINYKEFSSGMDLIIIAIISLLIYLFIIELIDYFIIRNKVKVSAILIIILLALVFIVIIYKPLCFVANLNYPRIIDILVAGVVLSNLMLTLVLLGVKDKNEKEVIKKDGID